MQKGRWKLPEIPAAAADLHAVYLDLGPVNVSGFGMAKHPYSEIQSAAPWLDERERRLIRDMSGAYLDGHSRGEDPFAMPPYTE